MRILLAIVGVCLFGAAVLFVLARGDGETGPAEEPSPHVPRSGLERAMARLRNKDTETGRVHRPDRNVESAESPEMGRFDPLWQILEDEQAEDMVKESAALKLAAQGGTEAISRLWALWQAGKLPASCSWVVDMANEGAGLESESLAAQAPVIDAERVAEGIGKLMDAELTEKERRQAVTLLGSAGTADALAALGVIAGTPNSAPAALRLAAFEAIAANDVDKAASLLETMLPEEAMDSEQLIEYLESLEDEPSPVVTELALALMGHEDADVREEAAWLLALNIEEHPELLPEMIPILRNEAEPAVRRRLYDSLGSNAAGNAADLLNMVQQEQQSIVQVSGYQALARIASADTGGAAAELFDAQAVPILVDAALNSPDFQIRFGAFVALRLARTDGAAQAMRLLATSAADENIAQAAARAQ